MTANDSEQGPKKDQKRKTGKRRTCPTCGKRVPSVLLQCECGYHFQSRTVVSMGDRPEVSVQGGLLRVNDGAELPPYCVLCGLPTARRLHKTFYWPGDPSWSKQAAMDQLLGKLKQMDLAVPLCVRCAFARRKKFFAGIGLLVAVLPAGVLITAAASRLGVSRGNSVAGVLCVLLAIVGLGLLGGNKDILVAAEIDDEHGFGLFRGASREFLRRLPDING